MRSLVEHLRAQVPEFRRQEALAYPLAGFLALIALAMFSGVRRGPQDLAEYAATLSQGQLRALGFRTDKHTGRIRCPGESTFKRMLPQIDAAALERALLYGRTRCWELRRTSWASWTAKRCVTRTSKWSAPWTATAAGWARSLSKKAATRFPLRGNC